MRIIEYLEVDGSSPFAAWFGDLNSTAAAKITVALARISTGHASNLKGVGGGVLEWKVNFGPGYRIYLGRGRRSARRTLGLWYEAAPEPGYRNCRAAMAGPQAAREGKLKWH